MLTYVDDDGKRQSMHWFLPRSKEDVQRRRAYHEFWFRQFKGGIFTRPPAGMNVVMYAQVDDPEPWAANSIFKGPHRDLSGNIERQWARVTRDDVAISPMFLDVQYDRGRDDAMGETPMLAIQSRRPTRASSSGAGRRSARRSRSSTSCSSATSGVPARPPSRRSTRSSRCNTPGVSIVARESRAQPDADPYDRPLATIGDELDGMVYFDDVLIPWDQVQHVGNPDHAKWYPQRQFDWVHLETQIRHTVHAELMVGLALLLTEALGTNKSPVVQSQLADLVRFRETCRAFMISAEETGFHTAGGLYKPNNIFVDFGRAHYLEHQHEMVNMLIDFCGRGVVIQPTKRELDDPYIGPKLEEALKGSHDQRDGPDQHLPADQRALPHRVGRPPRDVREVQRDAAVPHQAADDAAHRVPGRRAAHQLARDVLGFGDTEELARRAEEAEQASHYANVRYQPEYAREQDVQQGYYASR